MMADSPKIWRRFEKTLKDGTQKKFKIQEVPESMYEEVFDFMTKNFLPDEPFTLSANILNNPKAFQQLKNFWTKYLLPQKFSLICFEDDETNPHKDIVGINLLLYCVKGNEERPPGAEEPQEILKILEEVGSRFDIYEKFGVDRYLGAAGLCVNKKFRGMNIGAEILLARTPLCKENHIKVTETIFTAVGSQVLAAKAGFTTLLEIEFAELEEKLAVKFPDGFKTLKVMTKMIQ